MIYAVFISLPVNVFATGDVKTAQTFAKLRSVYCRWLRKQFMNKMLQYSQRTITYLTMSASFVRKVFCPLVFLVSIHAHAADSPKQISYPVPIQVEKTPVAPAPVVPAYSAPAPVIRTVDEASSVPSKPARKTVTKTETKKVVSAPAKKVTDTATKTKVVATGKKKNASAQKTAAASTAKKITPVKKPIAQTAKSNTANAANKTTAPAMKTAVNAAEKKNCRNRKLSKNTNCRVAKNIRSGSRTSGSSHRRNVGR